MIRASSLWQEFKGFALKGNMIDLAVAVVIGGAFGAVVNSMVKHLLMPLVSYVMPGKSGYLAWKLGRVEVGAFLGDLVNFLILAVAMFVLIVEVLGAIQKVAKLTKSDEPVTKECPYCLSTIPAKAVKCAHCTSDMPPEPEAGTTGKQTGAVG
jgi:large conductance mechanosensitive channel